MNRLVICPNCNKKRSKFTSCEFCLEILCIQCRNKNKPNPPCDVTNVCDKCDKEWSVDVSPINGGSKQ